MSVVDIVVVGREVSSLSVYSLSCVKSPERTGNRN